MIEPAPRIRSRIELVAPAAILIWRLFSQPVTGVWRDWVSILSAFWIVTILAGNSRTWEKVTVIVVYFLLGIYVSGQLPHTGRLLGLLP